MRARRIRQRAHIISSLQHKLGVEASGAVYVASFNQPPTCKRLHHVIVYILIIALKSKSVKKILYIKSHRTARFCSK